MHVKYLFRYFFQISYRFNSVLYSISIKWPEVMALQEITFERWMKPINFFYEIVANLKIFFLQDLVKKRSCRFQGCQKIKLWKTLKMCIFSNKTVLMFWFDRFCVRLDNWKNQLSIQWLLRFFKIIQCVNQNIFAEKFDPSFPIWKVQWNSSHSTCDSSLEFTNYLTNTM